MEAHPRTPTPQCQKGQIAPGRPLGGTQAFFCVTQGGCGFTAHSSCQRIRPSTSPWLGVLPCSLTLFFPSLNRPAISGNHASFSLRSLALAHSSFYTRCISVPMNIASTARCRKYIIWGMRRRWGEKKSKHVRVGDVSRLSEPTERLCVCHCMPAFVCVCVSVFQGACVCVSPCLWVSVSLLCAYACVEVTAGQHIVPQMFDILCIRGWLEREDKHVPDRSISPPQSATSAM